MKLIEPCCAPRHLREVRDAVGTSGTTLIEGYGDLSLTELMPALLTRYAETEMMIVAPALPDQAAEIIQTWMQKQWARSDGQGKINVIAHLTIVSELTKRKSPLAAGWLKENPFGERLTLFDVKQTETAILMPDFAIDGPVNMRYGNHFVATATGKKEDVNALWEKYKALTVQEKHGDAGKPEPAKGQEELSGE